ncbi:MAG: helix-turn-helix domain-containing protein [Actinobacteria bacterium]|nr:helix-turn-helix domain-containing protein [Actinomycetota bacterium]
MNEWCHMSELDDRIEWGIGERIRRLRKAALMTQDDLAAAAGVSTDLIRKLEQGQRHTCSITSLHRIARALDVDLGELLSRENMPDAAPDAGVVALRQAVADVTDLLGDVEGEPLSLRDAERSVAYLWGAYWSGKHERLVGLIPQALTGLRATLHAADVATRPTAAAHLAGGYWVAASTLADLRHPDAAFMALRRAVDLADSSDDALLAAALKGGVSWQLMKDGRFTESERLAVRTAASVEPRGDAPLQDLAVYGTQLVRAATAAARDDRGAIAAEFLATAGEVAQRLGCNRIDYESPFGPSLVTMQTVDANVVTKNYTTALDVASQMPSNHGLPLAAYCRHLTDRACAHTNLGQDEEALALLLTAEGMSPDWIRHHAFAHAVVQDLLAAEKARSTPLRALAERIGVGRDR